MMRTVLLLLVLLNGGYFAWGQGWLRAYGLGPVEQSEPHRLLQQIHPQAIEVLSDGQVHQSQATASAVAAVSTAVAASDATAAATEVEPALCLQSALLDPQRAQAVRTLLAALPAQNWQLQEVVLPERWIVYMGKYANTAELAKKRSQLDSLRLTFEPLTNSALAPGLSLGVFATQQQANIALDAFAKRGVRTARVLQEQPQRSVWRLHLPAVDNTVQALLPAVRLALGGQPLLACPQATRLRSPAP